MELYDYIDASGVIVPKTSEILADIQQKWLNIFPTMILDASTPQGRLMELLAQLRKEEIGLVALMANQINPQYATGERLDAIAGLFYIKRIGATSTTVNAVLTGKPLTYSTSNITWSDAGVKDGDVLMVNDISFVYGVDIEIGSTLSEVSTNTINAINADIDLKDILTAEVVDGGNGIKLTSKKLASLSGGLDNISVSFDSKTGTTNPEIESINGYTIIPAGSQASDVNNVVYSLSEKVLLDENGNGNGVFVCQDTGEIPCPAKTLTTIVSTVEGWETVNNPSDGTIGSEIESDESLYRRYNLSKTKYSMGYISSITGGIYEVDGVKSVYIYENDTSLPKTHASDPIIPVGETIEPHSVFIVVDGANASGNFETQVAEAIMKKKSAGCGMTAANESLSPHATVHRVTIAPEIGGGTFTAVFNSPAIIPIYIKIDVEIGSYTGSDVQSDIINLLTEWSAGNYNNEDGLQIGKSVSPFNISCVIQHNLGVYVKDCKIGLSSTSLGYNEIPVAITQKASIYADNVVVNAE